MPQYFTVTYIFHNIFFIVFHNGKEWGFINAIHNDKGGALIFDFSLADRRGGGQFTHFVMAREWL